MKHAFIIFFLFCFVIVLLFYFFLLFAEIIVLSTKLFIFHRDTELQIRGGIEDNSKILFLFLNKNIML